MGRSHDIPRRAGEFDGDDTGTHLLHVDMDAFFASVEVRRRPELRGLPVVVGGSRRGVVAAASYEARRFGVRSAMPMTQALQRCPQAVVLPPDRAAYAAVSEHVMAILRDVTPLVEPLSLDEAFLDVSAAVRRSGRPAQIARGIRARVAGELGLTCSVGVAGTKFMAKLASARCKPDGLLVVPVADTLTVLRPLPVSVLWGVGERTGQSLHRLGIRTVADLADTEVGVLERALGPAHARQLSELAHGHDPRSVDVREVEKSISSDRTLEHDLTDATAVQRELLRVSDEVARRVRSSGVRARTIGIKIRFADFRTVTRARTLAHPVDDTATIYATAVELYRSLRLDRPRVRLVGVRAEKLIGRGEASEQLELRFADEVTPADHVLDLARARFGRGAVGYAALLPAAGRDNGNGATGPVRTPDPAGDTSSDQAVGTAAGRLPGPREREEHLD